MKVKCPICESTFNHIEGSDLDMDQEEHTLYIYCEDCGCDFDVIVEVKSIIQLTE